MLRILFVIDSLTTGGAERHVVDLAAALRRRGHGVAVACSAAGELSAVLRRAGVRVHVLAPELVKRRMCPDYAERLREAIADLEPDVVHAHLFASAAAAAHATAGTGVPLVVTEQTEAPWRDEAARDVSRFTYEQAAHVVGVSTAICRMLHEEFGVPPDRVSRIANCVLPAPADPAPPRDLPTGDPLFGTVARLVPEKGIDTLLRAAARVREQLPGAAFAVAGDGPQRAELEALAGELGLTGTVHHLGRRADAPALIARFDALVVPSRSEGTPLVIAEALRAGTPVVATPVGGIPDQIRDGREGLLVPVDDEQALAAALCRLATERGLRDRLAAGATRRAPVFDHDRMVDRLEALLTAVARETAGAAA